MSKTKTAKPAKKAKETPEAVEQPEVPEITDQELQARNEKVTFVANNILNSITLNQAVTVIQQVALRDANTIVEEADEEKLKEIEDAMKQAIEAAASGTEAEPQAE